MRKFSKILITGATGFIGSHLTHRLVEEGFTVGIIKRQNSDAWRIKDILDKIKCYDVNLLDTMGIIKVVSDFNPDGIFHLATYYAVEHNLQEISLMIDTNVLGAINLLESSKETKVKLFVNTSTCFVYKDSENKLKENDDIKPLNLYALTKIQAEQACTFYSEKYDLQTITFRLFPPYGPMDHERRLIPYAIKNFLEKKKLKLTTGEQKWDFVYVDDIVNAYLKLLSAHQILEKHEIFNIATGNAVSVREVISHVKQILNSKIEPEWGAIPHRKNEVWFTRADITKAKNFLKWQPKIEILEGGLELTVEWYKNFWKRGGKK